MPNTNQMSFVYNTDLPWAFLLKILLFGFVYSFNLCGVEGGICINIEVQNKCLSEFDLMKHSVCLCCRRERHHLSKPQK